MCRVNLYAILVYLPKTEYGVSISGRTNDYDHFRQSCYRAGHFLDAARLCWARWVDSRHEIEIF
jgi:hypothetical protein